MIKDKIQKEALELSKIHNYIVYEWATGVGKSLAAINIIEYYGGYWNIVLAETNHELNWIDEFKKHNKEHLLKNVSFFCYQSLHKNLNEENYIFDEVHHIQSEKRLNLLQQLHLYKLKRFIGLSATLTLKQKELIKNAIGNFHVHKISLSKAIEFEILPEPIVYFVGVTLDNTIKNVKYYFGKTKFIMCTQQEVYNRMSLRIETLKLNYFATQQNFDKIKWLRLANDRKKFLSSCKTPYAKELLETLKDKRLICFTGSIEQSEELSNGLSIHSKLGKKARELLISNFNNGISSKLFATGMLKEGMNFNNVEAGLIIQLDNVERYFAQISGRVLRALFPEQYVLFVKDTQDAVYVTTALENFNMDFVKFVELKDLK